MEKNKGGGKGRERGKEWKNGNGKNREKRIYGWN